MEMTPQNLYSNMKLIRLHLKMLLRHLSKLKKKNMSYVVILWDKISKSLFKTLNIQKALLIYSLLVGKKEKKNYYLKILIDKFLIQIVFLLNIVTQLNNITNKKNKTLKTKRVISLNSKKAMKRNSIMNQIALNQKKLENS